MYEKYLCYQTYDVTGLLKEGENTLELYVGDGWYCGPKTQPAGPGRRPVHAVLFQLRLEYKSGAAETICSDKQVQASQGPVRSSDLFAGELYDARKKPVSKKPVKQKDYGYEALRAQGGEPILPILTLPVQKKYLSPRGETILDFGQIMAGRVRMDLELPWGTKVILDHFEATDREGNYFNSFERGMGKHCDQRDVYISDGTRQTYEPYFTYHGFRYVRVQLIPPQTGESQTLPEIKSQGFYCCGPLHRHEGDRHLLVRRPPPKPSVRKYPVVPAVQHGIHPHGLPAAGKGRLDRGYYDLRRLLPAE